MNATSEVYSFLNKLAEHPVQPVQNLVEVINEDVGFFSDEITDAILSRRMRLDSSWEGFKLSDVDILYEENMLSFASKLEMYGIRNLIGTIRGRDKALLIHYRFTDYGLWNMEMDSLACFHVVVQQTAKTIHRWIVVYG